MTINDFIVKIRKTKKIKVDDASHNLPPDLGGFKEYSVADYFCPDEWSKDGIFIPVSENEPMWFDFRGNEECACIVSVQRLNPITGESADLENGLRKDPKQNYMKLPEQKWLDGYSRDGKVYQFVVTKAGEGLAVNEYLLPKYMQDSHAIGFAFFGPKNPKPKVTYNNSIWYNNPIYSTPVYKKYFHHYYAGNSMLDDGDNYLSHSGSQSVLRSLKGKVTCSSLHPDIIDGRIDKTSYCLAPEAKSASPISCNQVEACISSPDVDQFSQTETIDILKNAKQVQFDKASMGAGGRIKQEVLTDNNTIDYYVEKPSAILTVYLALPEQFQSIMSQGRRQDYSKKDDYTHSGKIGEIQVPLI